MGFEVRIERLAVAGIQRVALQDEQTDRRGGLLKRWRARRKAAATAEDMMLAVMNVWAQWPHDWWSTESLIGSWRPDDIALDALMADEIRDIDISMASRAVADAGAASEILGWFTMAAVDKRAGGD